MNLTFNDPSEFEDFAKIYLLGRAAQHSGFELGYGQPATAPDALAAAVADLASGLRAAQTATPDVDTRKLFDTEQGDAPSIGFPKEDLPEGSEELTFDPVTIPDEAPEGENVQAEPPKRKRRTKAEIAAAEALEKAALQAEGNGPAVTEAPEDNGVAEVAAIATQVATTAASLATEAEAKVQAARAVYTPELVETLRGHAELFDNDRKAHLVEARDAISKKGFIAYNATMQGLGLGPSVATYSDDEVKLHRAAIAHLLAS